MSLNLHAITRAAIQSVNPDISATYLKSTGYTTDGSGARTPSYVSTDVKIQVQALTGKDLQHPAMQNAEGVLRAVYMYGNTQGVVRPDVKGGDLLEFPQVQGGTPQQWLVVAVLETWSPDAAGWCKLGVNLQINPS
jgi:hypothetical protein